MRNKVCDRGENFFLRWRAQRIAAMCVLEPHARKIARAQACEVNVLFTSSSYFNLFCWRSQHFPVCCHNLRPLGPNFFPFFLRLMRQQAWSVLEHTVCPFPLTWYAELASNIFAYPGMDYPVLPGRRCPTFARQAFRRSAITWSHFDLRILTDRLTSTLR